MTCYLVHRRPEGGGQPGAVASPWNLKMMTSYAVFVQNTLKFSLAPSALASNTLKLSLKRRKNREKFRLRLRRAEKQVIFVSSRGFAPLWKNSCGRPWYTQVSLKFL